jgi:hypothetical protein
MAEATTPCIASIIQVLETSPEQFTDVAPQTSAAPANATRK